MNENLTFLNVFYLSYSDVTFLKDCVGSEVENAISNAAPGLICFYMQGMKSLLDEVISTIQNYVADSTFDMSCYS